MAAQRFSWSLWIPNPLLPLNKTHLIFTCAFYSNHWIEEIILWQKLEHFVITWVLTRGEVGHRSFLKNQEGVNQYWYLMEVGVIMLNRTELWINISLICNLLGKKKCVISIAFCSCLRTTKTTLQPALGITWYNIQCEYRI